MRRLLTALVAAVLGLVLALVPAGYITPAQAVAMLAPNPCANTGSVTSLTANSCNLPILVEAGLVSAGGATAATGGTAALAAGTALPGGMMGFGLTVGASAALGMGVLKLHGIDDDTFIKTDPDYVSDGLASFIGTQSCSTSDPSRCVEAYAVVPRTAGGVYLCLQSISGSSPGNSAPRLWRADGTTAGGYTRYQPWPVDGCPANSPSGGDYGRGWAVLSDGTPVVAWAASTSSGWTRVDIAPTSDGYHGTIRTTLTCTNAAGTSYVMKSARVDVAQGDPIPVPPASCGEGSVAAGVLVEYQADGSSLWVEVGTALAPGTVTDLPEVYPDCFPVSGVATCYLELQRHDGTRWESCGPLASFCPTWVQDWLDNPAVYRCKYGDYAVSIDLCSAFRKPGTLLPNHEEGEAPEDEPVALPPTAPEPPTLPNPLEDTETGEHVQTPPWLNIEGEPTPDEAANGCFPTGWGVLNPVSWVLMPVQCALKWAFVPRAEAIQRKIDDLRFRANGWVVPAMAVVTSITGAVTIAASGCEGPPLRLNIAFPGGGGIDETYYPMNACDEPMKSVASAVNGMLSFSVIAWMGLAVVRYFMSLVGYVPFGGSGGGTRYVDSRTGEVLD